MLIGEPPRTQFDLNFSITRIPVRVHPLFWLVTVLLGIQGATPVTLLMWVAVVFVSILIHEFGHALTMRYYGWQPSVILYGMGGLATYNAGFTSSRSSYARTGNSPRAQIAISFAGPLAGFLFAGSIIVGLYLSGRSVPFLAVTIGHGPWIENTNVLTLVRFLLYVNIFWGLINLFPINPLDGGQIAREIFLVFSPTDGVRQSLLLSVFAGAGLAIFCWVRMRQPFMAMLFGYLAYSSYSMLQNYTGPGGFGGGFRGGSRPW